MPQDLFCGYMCLTALVNLHTSGSFTSTPSVTQRAFSREKGLRSIRNTIDWGKITYASTLERVHYLCHNQIARGCKRPR